jgi:hypothetical protein
MTKAPPSSPDLFADLELLPSTVSRRTRPLADGWRGLLRVAGTKPTLDVQLRPLDKELWPEERGAAELWFLFRDIPRPTLQSGDKFELLEGSAVIAQGVTLRSQRNGGGV